MFVCTRQGACCASIFTDSVSDRPNESPENHYLPALSCSVLSSLFSHSVYSFLFSPPLLAVCLPLHMLPPSVQLLLCEKKPPSSEETLIILTYAVLVMPRLSLSIQNPLPMPEETLLVHN